MNRAAAAAESRPDEIGITVNSRSWGKSSLSTERNVIVTQRIAQTDGIFMRSSQRTVWTLGPHCSIVLCIYNVINYIRRSSQCALSRASSMTRNIFLYWYIFCWKKKLQLIVRGGCKRYIHALFNNAFDSRKNYSIKLCVSLSVCVPLKKKTRSPKTRFQCSNIS